MKKTAILILTLALLSSMCCLFTASAEGNLSAPGAPGPIWLGAEPRVINILTPENPKVSDFSDNEYTKWIEQSCNVKFNFTLLPFTDTASKLSTMIAGDQLRSMGINVVNYLISLTQAKNFADNGAFMDLSEYFQRGLAVNCDKAVANYPHYNLIKTVTTADGKIYGIPKIQISPSNEAKYKIWVNEAWLNKLGMKAPRTTQEFHDMLVRFKNEDPNGNGKADEIPFVTSNGFGGTPTKNITNSFVFEGEGDMFMLKDGQVTVSYIQPEWFEANDYLKQLHDEGLLADQAFTYSNDDLKAVLTADDTVGVVTGSSLSFIGNTYDPVRLRFAPMEPLIGPNGVQQSSFAQSQTQPCWFVTPWTKEQDPELAELCFRVGDFQFCEEGFLRGRFGLEGQNWSKIEDYKKDHPNDELVFIPAYPEIEGNYVFFNDVRDAEVNNLYWYEHMPYFSGTVEAEAVNPNPDKYGKPFDWENSTAYRIAVATRVYQDFQPGTSVTVPPLIFSDDELDTLGDMQSNIISYVNEQRTKYILGQQSDLSNPEQFINNLKNTFFLDTLLEVANTAYQREYAAQAKELQPLEEAYGREIILERALYEEYLYGIKPADGKSGSAEPADDKSGSDQSDSEQSGSGQSDA